MIAKHLWVLEQHEGEGPIFNEPWLTTGCLEDQKGAQKESVP